MGTYIAINQVADRNTVCVADTRERAVQGVKDCLKAQGAEDCEVAIVAGYLTQGVAVDLSAGVRSNDWTHHNGF